VLLPDEDAPALQLNEVVLSSLLDFGVPLEAAKKAVYFTKGVGPEEAYKWYEDHLNDAGLLSPFVAPGSQPSKSKLII